MNPPHLKKNETQALSALKRTLELAEPENPIATFVREGEPMEKLLRLLATGMSNPEIADELVVAVSTVHSHCKRIYSKLGVHSRWDAVQRAQKIGLI